MQSHSQSTPVLLEMAESVGIVLDFLRQHNFGRAEEALLSELHARHSFAGSVHGPNNKVEQPFYTEGFPAHEPHFYVNKSTSHDMQPKPESDAPEKCGSIVTQRNLVPALTEWEFKSCSNQDCVLEFRKQDAQSRMSPSEAEHGVRNNGMGQMNCTHQSPIFSQKQHQDHEIFYFRSGSLHQQACSKPHLQTNGLESVLHTTRHACRDDYFQQELGASEMKKCTAVHMPMDFSEKVASEGKANAFHSHIQSFASSAYDAFSENTWLDHGVPDKDALKSSKFMQPSFLPFPSSEGFEQQDEKQVVHDCIDYLKALGLENQTHQTDFLKDMKLPWEVGLQNGFAEGELVVNERQTPDFFVVPPAYSRSTNGDFCFVKGSVDGLGFEKILDGQNQEHPNAVFEPSFNIGSFLDIPVGQEIALPGDKQENGISRLSASRNCMQDTPELLSGFATLGDEPVDPGVVYCKEYWDSDMYEDDEDPGYERQLIEDEDWFLAHEVCYPSDDDKAKLSSGKATEVILGHNIKGSEFVSEKEDSSLFSGELLYDGGHDVSQAKLGTDISSITNLLGHSSTNVALTLNQIGNMSYDGHLMDAEELKLMSVEPVWQGFGPQMEEQVLRDKEDSGREFGKSNGKSLERPMRCINVTDLRTDTDTDEAAEGSKWGRESLYERMSQGYVAPELILSYDDDQAMYSAELIGNGGGIPSCLESDLLSRDIQQDCSRDESPCLTTFDIKDMKGYKPEPSGFSFSSQFRNCDLDAYNSGAGCPAWLKGIVPPSQDRQAYHADVLRSDDNFSQSHEPSPISSPKSETCSNLALFQHLNVSNHFAVDNKPCETRDEGATLCIYDSAVNEPGMDDEETNAVQEELQLVKTEEDEFEVFSLRIIHRKNRTGFEEEKHFQVVINSVIAGRYLITEYLGSAAFSKAVQARDLQTGMDVCMKIIKNNKDFFDQSLDEIKLLKFINKNDPADKHHILRLYDYFYHREHLFIVCELLRANLYEFHKFNRESGGEAYFTMARLQSITRQCLEALEFLHCLGLIHCDLKPENILIKSYSRCEIKVIDLGSSCFETDHLCSYVQSRSYRAPEVILGLPYDQKIDIWSLGCILAELCSGNVLFQNDSLATLLARVVGIIGPIMPDMILKGREAHKYFTKNSRLYERNQDTNKLEYLVPKKSSLRHRLSTGDQGFVDFVGYLLQVNPENRPRASEALKHPWLTYPYEPIC